MGAVRDEKLRAVRVGTFVGHRHNAALVVLWLVLKRHTVRRRKEAWTTRHMCVINSTITTHT